VAEAAEKLEAERSDLVKLRAAAAALERRASEAEAARRRLEGGAAAAEARAEELQRQLRVRAGALPHGRWNLPLAVLGVGLASSKLCGTKRSCLASAPERPLGHHWRGRSR
jgi:hypothetical protein